MTGWLKALLVIATVLVILIIASLGVGAVWFLRNREALKAQAKEAAAEGRNFGLRSDNQGCVDEGALRYKKEPGLFNSLKYGSFIDGCLTTSRGTPGFCDHVPLGDLMKMASWREAQCQRYDLANDRNCQGLLTPVMMFCGEKNRNQTNLVAAK